MLHYYDFVDMVPYITVGTDGWCLPRHRMTFNSRNEGSKGV